MKWTRQRVQYLGDLATDGGIEVEREADLLGLAAQRRKHSAEDERRGAHFPFEGSLHKRRHYAYPLTRSRARSLWVDAAVRWLNVDQSLRAIAPRDDEIVSLTVGLNGNGRFAGGVLRGDLDVVAGLPVPGVTHEGDRLASRADGDARLVLATMSPDWTSPVAGPLSLRLASTGQLASRPLLASPEIGAGGPSFGPAYDYSERTGDQGILGSAELRVDIAQGGSSFLSRMQIFGFIDGGYVDNLRRGVGGGSLLSAGGGVRIGRGAVAGGIEIAVPLNSVRFDTNDRRPRVSTRV